MEAGDEGGGPVACTLAAADLAAQGERWKRLAARAMSGRAEIADGLRVFFRGEDEDVEAELRRLVAVENECCAWAAWTVQAGAGQVVLEVRSGSAEGVAVLHGLFTGTPG